jgi:hypothetical protein
MYAFGSAEQPFLLAFERSNGTLVVKGFKGNGETFPLSRQGFVDV